MTTTRTLAKGFEVLNDTHRTKLNNNDLIIGPSGCGKTSGYVIPNILGTYGSYVIADTKGNLYRKLASRLEAEGYHVRTLDFVEPGNSCGYNPLRYIRKTRNGRYDESDICRIASALCPVDKNDNEKFWYFRAQDTIAALIAYVLETYPDNKQNLTEVSILSKSLGVLVIDSEGRYVDTPAFRAVRKIFELGAYDPMSFAYRKIESLRSVMVTERTWPCILQFVHMALSIFDMAGYEKMSKNRKSIFLPDIGREKTALFVNISDTDRSCDKLIDLFYTQLFQQLCSTADKSPASRLDVPVRIILDDFATNVYIPDFDKLISVIRSREISVSIIIQSLTQLDALYDHYRARTIINNCDHLLYLGGQDLETAHYISERANKPLENILYMPLDRMMILERGQQPVFSERVMPEETEPDIWDEFADIEEFLLGGYDKNRKEDRSIPA
ncbi:MAG: type IV secretory system conjugative DNA transfer family protein [Ruminiclostridium sp.]|nr:type IV secretory system conjugative DNA transfer family protein [Ruminiclostridium sp.]